VAMVADARARGRQDLPSAPRVDGLAAWILAATRKHQHRGSSELRARGDGNVDQAGTYSIICNEYCGINHHTMASRLYVVKPQ